MMNTIVKLEETALFIFGIYLFSLLSFEWWWFLVLILAPDLSMLGYLFGNKSGAFFIMCFIIKELPFYFIF